MRRDTHDPGERLNEARQLKARGSLAEAAQLLTEELPNADGTMRTAMACELADVRGRQGMWTDAHAVLNEVAEGMEEGPERAPIDERRSWLFFRQGESGQARALAQGVVTTRGVSDALLASARNTLAGIAWHEGRVEDAARELALAGALYETIGDAHGAAVARTNQGILCFTRGAWNDAAQSFSASERIRREAGWETGRASNLLNLGWLEASRGNHAQARQRLEDSLATAKAAGEDFDVVRAEIALAHLDVIEGKIDHACELLDSATQGQGCVCEDDLIQAEWLKALIECDRGGAQQGVRIAAGARERARASNLPEIEADCCRALGVSYGRCGEYDRALTTFEDALTLAEAIGDPYRRGLALLELGLLHRQSDRKRGQPMIEEAAGLFGRVGARYDLRRAESALRGE